jgi:hypothetical protein
LCLARSNLDEDVVALDANRIGGQLSIPVSQACAGGHVVAPAMPRAVYAGSNQVAIAKRSTGVLARIVHRKQLITDPVNSDVTPSD